MLADRAVRAALAGALVGLTLAAVALLAWWLVEGRHRPARVERGPDALEAYIESASWISLGAGARPVYVAGPRGSSAVETWLSEDARRLAGRGREVRLVPTLAPHAPASEQALVGALWAERDPALLPLWLASPAAHDAAGALPQEGAAGRAGAIQAARRFSDELERRVRRPGEAGRWPLVFWRDADGGFSLCVCDSARAVALAREVLGIAEEPLRKAEERREAGPRAEAPTYPFVSAGAPFTERTGADEIFAARGPVAREPARLPGDPVSSPAPQRGRKPGAVGSAVPPSARASAPPPQPRQDAESLFF